MSAFQSYLINNKVNNILLFTDLEPDDYQAIWAIYHYASKETIKLYITLVVGEGKVDKTFFADYIMKNFQEHYNQEGYKIVNGIKSDKDYPIECKSNLADINSVAINGVNINSQEFTQYMLNNQDIIVCLKPIRELLSILDNESVINGFVINIPVFIYGSFNIRTLMKTTEDLENKLLKLINKCKVFYWVESFHMFGTNNSINPKTAKTAMENLDKNKSIIAREFVNIMNSWNTYIIKDCQDTVDKLNLLNSKELTDKQKSKLERNKKVIKNISMYVNSQFVAADGGVIFAEINDFKNVNFNGFDSYGYPIFKENKESNLYIIMDDSVNNEAIKEKRFNKFVKHLVTLFESK